MNGGVVVKDHMAIGRIVWLAAIQMQAAAISQVALDLYK